MLSLVLALLAAPQDAPTVQVAITREAADLYFEGALLPMQGCADGASDIAHFMVGDQAIRIPRTAVTQFIPETLKMAGEPPYDFDTGEFLLPANAGCAEAATSMAILTIDAQTPALPNGVRLTASKSFSDEDIARLRDGGRCGHTDAEYVLCSIRVRQEQKYPTSVLISRTETARDGGPLFVTCEVKDSFVPPEGQQLFIPHESMACSIHGSRGGMAYEAVLGVKPLVNDMRAADAAATDLLDRISTP